MMYLMLLMAITALCYAVYSFYSIRGKTAGYVWHFAQWISAFLLALTGYYIHELGLTWRLFGNLMAVAIPTYIITLRAFQKYKK